MRASGLHVQRQVRLPIVYKDVHLPTGYRVDYIVEECLLVEIKGDEKVLPIHEAQLHTYLKLTGLKLGLLLNFNVPHLKDGIRSPTGMHYSPILSRLRDNPGHGCSVKSAPILPITRNFA